MTRHDRSRTGQREPAFRLRWRPAAGSKRDGLGGVVRGVLCCLLGLVAPPAGAEPPPLRYEAAPHGYWQKPLDDAFTRWWRENAARLGSLPPTATERDAVKRILEALEIPISSQMLVFSATSLQRTISPYRPRALYFNDEVYLGWVPGGRLEIAADDPALGPVFFIASLTRDGRLGEPERQTRCLNCHGNADTGNLPALLAASVLPDEDGGSLETLKDPGPGHHVPLDRRFGGWHLSDTGPAIAPYANLLGKSAAGRIDHLPNRPGDRFSLETYPLPSSRLLPQLVHEHQVGGVNVLTAALYRARELAAAGRPEPSADEAAELDRLAAAVTRYFLFSEEARLPAAGVPDDPEFARDFLRNRRPDAAGRSLKDLDLKSRLFRHRCSYLIYTPLWRGLPSLIKDRVWRDLDRALAAESPGPHGAHLPPGERQTIRTIIHETCADRPPWWKP